MASSPLRTPADVADALYAVFPRAVPAATLEEYGLDPTPEQQRRLTRELLALCLYWARCAMGAVLPPNDLERVMAELRARVLAGWDTELALRGDDPAAFFDEIEERRHAYDRIAREGGGPIDVSTEVAGTLEHTGAIAYGERGKVLALLLDLTPVDELGDIAQELDQA